jgi:threonine/homoserine/homoserine lactone efflux protein
MSILYAIGTAITAYIVVYTVLSIAGAVVFFLLLHKAWKEWRRGEREFKQMAEQNQKRRQEMRERMKEFEERWAER